MVGAGRLWVVMGLLAAAAGVGLLILPHLRPVEPESRDWLAAAHLVKAGLQPGDVVRIEPQWATGGRVYFADLDGLEARVNRLLDVHLPMDPVWLRGFSRVWMITAMGYGEEQLALLEREGFEPVSSEKVGPIEVHLLKLTASGVRWSLIDGYRELRLFEIKEQAEEPCKASGKSFVCPSGRISIVDKQVAGAPRRCLLTGLKKGNGLKLVLARPEGVTRMVIGLGNTLDSARLALGEQVTASVSQGDRLLAETNLEKGDYQWHTLDAEISESAGDSLQVVLSTESGAELHEVCLDGFLL